MQFILRLLGILALAFTLTGQVADPQVRINGLASDEETKFRTLDIMAADLGTHRNRLILLKKNTGQSFADIYAAELRKRGFTETAILERIRLMTEKAERVTRRSAGLATVHPVAYIGSSVDHSSAGTVVALNPEFGFDFRSVGLVAGLPIYRASSLQRKSTGIGDAYLSAFLRQPVRRYDVGAALTLGLPTGAREQGLGAGRVSVDVNGTIGRHLESWRPFISGGYTNSTFNNVGYQRPFISNGNAVYTSVGADHRIRRRWTVGAGGFGLKALGTQTVISQMARSQIGSAMAGMPDMGNGIHVGLPGHSTMIGAMPFGPQVPVTTVAARDASDYGPTGWLSWSPRADVIVTVRVARSFPNELTTVRVGVGFDLSNSFTRLRR